MTKKGKKFLILIQNKTHQPVYKIQLIEDIIQTLFLPYIQESFLVWKTEKNTTYSIVHLTRPINSPEIQKTRTLVSRPPSNRVYWTTFAPDQNRFQEELPSLVLEV